MAGWVLRPLKSAASPSSDGCVSSLKTQNCNSPCSLLGWRFSVELQVSMMTDCMAIGFSGLVATVARQPQRINLSFQRTWNKKQCFQGEETPLCLKQKMTVEGNHQGLPF